MDRNITRGQLPTPEPPSLSARRAWIEITGTMGKSNRAIRSLSARRAWIEITPPKSEATLGGQSLSARRAWIEIVSDSLPALKLTGRSPQGERG